MAKQERRIFDKDVQVWVQDVYKRQAESLSEYLPGVLRSSAYQIAAPGTP